MYMVLTHVPHIRFLFVIVPNCTPVTIGVQCMTSTTGILYIPICKEDDAELMKLFRKSLNNFEKKKTFTSLQVGICLIRKRVANTSAPCGD
jgi:hypothetical protein